MGNLTSVRELAVRLMKQFELGEFYPGRESYAPKTLPYLWHDGMRFTGAYESGRPVQNARLLPPWHYSAANLMAEANRTPVTIAAGLAQVSDKFSYGIGAPNMRQG